MSDSNEQNEQGADGGALRKQLEKVLADNKALTEKLSGFEEKDRLASLGEKLKDKGLNPKLARFVPADDASDQARLDAWINENSELFAPTGDGGSGGEGSDGASSVPEGEQGDWKRIQGASANGANHVVDEAALQAKIRACKNPAELDALMASLTL